MLTKISKAEEIAKKLAPESSERAEWTSKVENFAWQFIDNLPDLKAFHHVATMKGKLESNDFKDPGDIQDILDQLKEEMIDSGLNPASGGHLGYIPGGGIYGAALGDFIASVTNQYAGIFYGGPGAVKIENELIRWMAKMVRYPDTSLGNLTSGGSIANLIAIVTAREAKNIRSIEIPSLCIYLTEQVHHCVHKAIRISGLGESIVRYIKMDDRYRMDVGDLESSIRNDINSGLKPFLVVASAGTTDTGSMDPMNEIGEIAERYNLWYHIDAAYGGFFMLSTLENADGSYVIDQFKGIERSDSLAIDPHKGLFLSYGLGTVLIKDVKSQYQAHYYKAAYMQDSLESQEELSPCDLSPELTKHFRGMRLWIPLKLHGLDPFIECLNEKILLCRYFYEEVQKLGFEVGPYPELSVCIYRYIPTNGDVNDFNQKLVKDVVSDGRIFVSSTTIFEVFWIRIAILSFRTHIREIDLYLSILSKVLTDNLKNHEI
ncbi:MAG: aminotransferase class I/II-fold pyridoxal phosphate-dependent enzyme [Bacteroidota bacterium]|nr:aminotransferase class I/II-fold pyridoxal phosphate-dependent enzyme [Bacteroidota bacterium]